ncbi:MAG: hypothetical protein FWC58_00940, partial [Desulfobulbus sp.]|nr:hypothetical protein [Desulfobulbus sp.]
IRFGLGGNHPDLITQVMESLYMWPSALDRAMRRGTFQLHGQTRFSMNSMDQKITIDLLDADISGFNLFARAAGVVTIRLNEVVGEGGNGGGGETDVPKEEEEPKDKSEASDPQGEGENGGGGETDVPKDGEEPKDKSETSGPQEQAPHQDTEGHKPTKTEPQSKGQGQAGQDGKRASLAAGVGILGLAGALSMADSVVFNSKSNSWETRVRRKTGLRVTRNDEEAPLEVDEPEFAV